MRVVILLVVAVCVFMLGVWYENTTHVGKSIVKDFANLNSAIQYTKKLSREQKIKLLGN